MDAQTSFIPKRTLDTQARIQRADTVSIFTVLSTIVFFVVLLGAGAMFLWQRSLFSEVKNAEAQLVQQRQSFDEAQIADLVSLDTRLRIGAELLGNRLYTSKILQLLNANTISTVRFSKLSIDPSLVDKTKLRINLSGQARDYASIALQSDIFSKLSGTVLEYDFSNLTLDQAGNVVFDMTAIFDKRAVRFDAQVEQVSGDQALSEQGINPVPNEGSFFEIETIN